MKQKVYLLKDNLFYGLTLISSIMVITVVVAMLIVFFVASFDAVKHFGILNFIFSSEWNPVKKIFGGATSLYGTILTTFLAIIFAVPISLGIAVFVTQICPDSIKSIFFGAIELLASIPSIIYGMWGLFIFAPIMRKYIEPTLQKLFLHIPIVDQLFMGLPLGIDILTASLVLSIMLIPFITSIARDNFSLTPKELEESAYAMGSTQWEVVKDVIMPYSKIGVLSGIIIATGRALGETMAVAFVLGNDHNIHLSLLKSSTTIAVTLANEFTEADFHLYISSLFYLALILFIASFILLGSAKYIVRRTMK